MTKFSEALLMRSWILPVLAVFVFGCDSGKIKCFPVSGKVEFPNAPSARTASVIFHPVGDKDGSKPRPQGAIEKDGTFALSTQGDKDGAPAGEYAVTIVWQVAEKGDNEDAVISDILAGTEYGSADKTPLKVNIEKATVLEPFKITLKKQ